MDVLLGILAALFILALNLALLAAAVWVVVLVLQAMGVLAAGLPALALLGVL